MIEIGVYQKLKIHKEKPQGLYLLDEEHDDEVLLPNAECTPEMEIGDYLNVFVYLDSETREIATLKKAALTLDSFASLKVVANSSIGAFCDWGLQKDLLVPFHEQAEAMQEGRHYIVYMYLDDVSERLVGTTKLRRYLKPIADETIIVGETVDALIYQETNIGYKAVVNQKFSGLVYKSDISHGSINVGDVLKLYVKPMRQDKKIDLSLNPIGFKNVVSNVDVVLEALEKNGGFLPYNDKSSPEKIREKFGVSKKVFKKIIGVLYKQKQILIEEKGITKV
jgi:predicted RNA-binding protein (virulence factor B family)